MSTFSEREAVLRRALLAAAEQVEPSPDGLERIQIRLRPPRPFVMAWLEAAWTDLILRTPSGLQSAGRRLVRAVQPVWDRMQPVWERIAPRSAADGRRRPMAWIRPLAAMSVAVFVIAAGAYVAFSDSTFLGAPAGSSSSSPSGHGGGTGSGPAPKGSNSPLGSGLPSSSPARPSASASATPCASGSPRQLVSPPTSSNPAPSSSSLSPSPSATPTPSDSTSVSPGPSASAGLQGGTSGSSTGPASSALSALRTTAFVQVSSPGASACRSRHRRPHHRVQATPAPSTAAFGNAALVSRRESPAID